MWIQTCVNRDVFFFIRIKFRRVNKNVSVTKADVGSGKNNSLAAKVSMISHFTSWTKPKCKHHHNYGLMTMKYSLCISQTSEDSKKRKQAKKLVEKAKVIQQSKKAAVEEKDTLRRSSRAEASAKKSYCEDEVRLKANKHKIIVFCMNW